MVTKIPCALTYSLTPDCTLDLKGPDFVDKYTNNNYLGIFIIFASDSLVCYVYNYSSKYKWRGDFIEFSCAII